MTGSDYFTANQIWRSKYFENLQKGMNETEAWFSKDTWNFVKKEEEKRKENNETEKNNALRRH